MDRCELCNRTIVGRRYSRRDFANKHFCSIVCVEAFEVRNGLPSGRIYETKSGWSPFPVAPPAAQLAS